MNALNVTVGQEVAIARHGSWSVTYTFGTVVKVTPTGQMTVADKNGNKTSFTNEGKEKSGGHFSRYVKTNVEQIKASLEEQKLRVKAASAINAVKPEDEASHHWSKATMLEEIKSMKDRLAAAESMVNDIPDSLITV